MIRDEYGQCNPAELAVAKEDIDTERRMQRHSVGPSLALFPGNIRIRAGKIACINFAVLNADVFTEQQWEEN